MATFIYEFNCLADYVQEEYPRPPSPEPMALDAFESANMDWEDTSDNYGIQHLLTFKVCLISAIVLRRLLSRTIKQLCRVMTKSLVRRDRLQ